MFGVGRRQSPRIGTVWFLASDDFVRARDLVRRESRYWVDVLMVGHDVLTNFVAADNRIAVRWISWLGFELLALHRQGSGIRGEDFWEFAAFRAGTRSRVPLRGVSSRIHDGGGFEVAGQRRGNRWRTRRRHEAGRAPRARAER